MLRCAPRPRALLFVLLLAAAPVAAQPFETKLVASDGAPDRWYGVGVAVDGDVAMVGAYSHDARGDSAGAVYVYGLRDGAWVEEQILFASDAADFTQFGLSMDVEGDLAVIGARGDAERGPNAGAAYVFRHDGARWVEEAKLLGSDTAVDDLFGENVALSGDRIVVGAQRGMGNFRVSGAAYVFRFDGVDWVEEAKLIASDGAFDDELHAVAISGDVIVAGSFLDDDLGDSSGSAYVFHYDGVDWVEEQKLLAFDGGPFHYYGDTVAISGDRIAVTAVLANGATSGTGAVYLYRRGPGGWSLEQKLAAADLRGGALFGRGLALDGSNLLVGAPSRDAGAAYLFRRIGGVWQETSKLLASDGSRGDSFGNSAALSGGTGLVGARFAQPQGSRSGAAYLYEELVPPPPPLTVDVDIKPGGCPNAWNRNGNGVLPVAIVAGADLDPHEVDLDRVVIARADGVGGEVSPHRGPPGPGPVFGDVATPFEGEACGCHDAEGDGRADLQLFFRTQELAEALGLGDTPFGALPELIVRGVLRDGTPFAGSDCVRLAPPGGARALTRVVATAPGAWIDVTPLDGQLDGGGFTPFDRSHPRASELELSAAPVLHGWNFFRGWRVDGGPLRPERQLSLTADAEAREVEAVYTPVACGLGMELALVLPPLLWWRRALRSRHR